MTIVYEINKINTKTIRLISVLIESVYEINKINTKTIRIISVLIESVPDSCGRITLNWFPE
jgi:hypothetical protein